jgi:hypothetical protein
MKHLDLLCVGMYNLQAQCNALRHEWVSTWEKGFFAIE